MARVYTTPSETVLVARDRQGHRLRLLDVDAGARLLTPPVGSVVDVTGVVAMTMQPRIARRRPIAIA